MEGQKNDTITGVQAAIRAGLPPGEILNKGMVDAMAEMGRLFEEGEYFVPEMLIAARATQSGLALLKPHLIEADIESANQYQFIHARTSSSVRKEYGITKHHNGASHDQ